MATDEIPKVAPDESNPRYWSSGSNTQLLLGGSWQDNPFNHPTNLEAHLEKLTAVGGNYLRNVMSHRNEGNVYPYERDGDLFDLDRFNSEYWNRFERFLELTAARDIVVQLEIWATHDHYHDHQSRGGWSYHPYNPANNSTYSPDESGLPTAIEYAPGAEPTEHPFFRTVPRLDDNDIVRAYQTAFVDAITDRTFEYPHVLYCINNETGERLEWGDYWVEYIRDRATDHGIEISTTDMRRNEDVTASDHDHIYDSPEKYTFVDISQNNAWAGEGQQHYDNIRHVMERTESPARPINNVKNYGAIRHGEDESIARFCRIIFAGCASARFHRPHPIEDPSQHEAKSDFGLGLSPRAQRVIQSMRELTDKIDLRAARPAVDRLSNREPNEAYVLANPRDKFALYFPDGGAVTLSVQDSTGTVQETWIDIDSTEWDNPRMREKRDQMEIEAPGSGHWGVILKSD